eukprot:7172675-Alexandrium_andersonii.AAC.1
MCIRDRPPRAPRACLGLDRARDFGVAKTHVRFAAALAPRIPALSGKHFLPASLRREAIL